VWLSVCHLSYCRNSRSIFNDETLHHFFTCHPVPQYFNDWATKVLTGRHLYRPVTMLKNTLIARFPCNSTTFLLVKARWRETHFRARGRHALAVSHSVTCYLSDREWTHPALTPTTQAEFWDKQWIIPKIKKNISKFAKVRYVDSFSGHLHDCVACRPTSRRILAG